MAVSMCVPVLAPLVFQVKFSEVEAPAAKVTLCGALIGPAVPPPGGVSLTETLNVSANVP